jgi:phage recombination protein Bet
MANELSSSAGPLAAMALSYGIEAAELERTIRETCGCKGASREEFVAFTMVCSTYGLNPILREVFAFPKKGGGIQPIVSVDGWFRIAERHPQFDGITFEDKLDSTGRLIAITARVHRKDRAHPVEVTEYLAECNRGGDTPWKQWPARMLRHKAAIQCLRYAFGISGIVDQDEYERAADKPREPVIVRPKFTEPPVALPAPAEAAAQSAYDKALAAIARATSLDRCDSLRRNAESAMAEGRLAGFEYDEVVAALVMKAEQLLAKEEVAQ